MHVLEMRWNVLEKGDDRILDKDLFIRHRLLATCSLVRLDFQGCVVGEHWEGIIAQIIGGVSLAPGWEIAALGFLR